MGKGLNKYKNKQADLKRKLELAKEQNKKDEGQEPKKLTDEEIKEQNDRKRFEQLLQREGAKAFNDYDSDGYLNIKLLVMEAVATTVLNEVSGCDGPYR